MAKFPKPVICALNGVAAGGGVGIALASDLIFASEKGKMSIVFTNIGFTLDSGSSFYLPRRVGIAKAKELMLTRRIVQAQEALEIGLVDRVYPVETFMSEVMSFAEGLAQGPTYAYAVSYTHLTAVAGAGDVELELANGINFPTHWALRAQKRMELIGTTAEEYAMVSVKSHKNAQYNPRAQYQKPLTLEQVLNGRMIADPMTQFMCSGIGDGSAAIILCEKEKAKKYTSKMITLKGFGIATGEYDERRDITFNDIEKRCGEMLYENTGIGPKDIDFAEVHDCFSIAEFMRVEGLGLFEYGEYGHALRTGECEIGGRLPINPSGGLLSKGHPIAATGVAQMCEAVWQLRGECGQRQVEGARTALTHCSGGGIAGDGAVSVASMVQKDY